MSDTDRLRKETHEYLKASVNTSYYMEHIDNPRVKAELTQRVLNARSWTHELPSFESVLEVVVAAARSFKPA